MALRISRTVFSALSATRLLACLIVAPQRGYDEPGILSYAISSFCPTSADGLQCNDGAIRTDRESVYEDIVGSLRQRLSKFEEKRHSDIVRTVLLAAKEEAVNGRKLSLYIYSDLIENSEYLSGQRFFSTPVPQLLAKLQKDKLIPALKNADVHVAGVGRGATKDRRPLTVAEQRKVTEFWEAYFKESGADSVDIGQNIPEPSR